MPHSSTHRVPAAQNILDYSARFIIESSADLLPDLSSLFVFLPHSRVAPAFNTSLCQATRDGPAAIIPPWSGTLRSWANQHLDKPQAHYRLLNEHARQLLFIEALQEHPSLFKEENQWQVTQALLRLFDELSLNQVNLFDSAESWRQQLREAYGIDAQEADFDHLSHESQLVYTLWHAWRQQLDENELCDETGDYLARLSQAESTLDANQRFICLGLSQYCRAEQTFLQQLIDAGRCQVIDFADTMSGSGEADDARARLIDETFQQVTTIDSPSIKQRAQAFAGRQPDAFDIRPPFSIYLASDDERQVRAIDYFIRLQLLAGQRNIGIISEDRKLSRRLRALLERATVPLQDNAGWTLATTQAASIVERWLECIEEDFSAYPLLDCLKSPFIDICNSVLGEQASADEFRQNIYRFEHDLVFHENVSSGIERYKSQLGERLQRLSHWPANTYQELVSTLDYIQQAATPLLKFYETASHDRPGKNRIKLSQFFQALSHSLQQLGVFPCYQQDEAGRVLLDTFQQLEQSLQYADPELSWNDCRSWLGMALEAQHFTPSTPGASVQLMTLEQSSHLSFDCLIIAAAEPQHYPGNAASSPFFNQSVRASLGLDTWEQQRQLRHEQFNRALLSAPTVLITAVDEDNGEKKAVSPWLELLMNFYTLGFGGKTGASPLQDRKLEQLVDAGIEVFNCDEKSLPEPSTQPASTLPRELLPERVSASAYQRIVNCPYQFFSGDGLHLSALEELSDELNKAAYGERIHSILQTFHRGHKRFGKAFAQQITTHNRDDAECYLNRLSERVFIEDLEDNVLHRSWLYRWQKHIPAYISWQIEHQHDWNIYLNEVMIERPLSAAEQSINIYGRLDRVDINRSDGRHAIIDYKTGSTASQDEVDSGENVQLSLYALLDDEASCVQYLSVDSSEQKVETRATLLDEQLQDNREHNRQRLLEIFNQLENGQPLPAWGDDKVCRYCRFSGLCRKPVWTGDEA